MGRFLLALPAPHFRQFSAGFGLISLLFPAGCATVPKPCPPSVPQIQIQKEIVAVPSRCINKADVPLEPGPVVKTGDSRNDLDFAGAKIADLRKWGRSLVAMIEPCER